MEYPHTPKPELLTDIEYDGLKAKYRVYKARNGEPVEDCFVLRPNKDPAARAALHAYADATDNQQLAEDIGLWLNGIGNRKSLEAHNG